MMTIMQLVLIVSVGLASVAYILSKIEFGRKENHSPISKQHRKFFNV